MEEDEYGAARRRHRERLVEERPAAREVVVEIYQKREPGEPRPVVEVLDESSLAAQPRTRPTAVRVHLEEVAYG